MRLAHLYERNVFHTIQLNLLYYPPCISFKGDLYVLTPNKHLPVATYDKIYKEDIYEY